MSDVKNAHYNLVRGYILDEGLSKSEIVERLKGRIAPTSVGSLIRDVLRDHADQTGVYLQLKKRRSGGFARLSTGKAVSQLHQAVGVRLNNFRTIKSDLSVYEFCQRYEFSNHIRIRQMEMGQHDFSLSELMRISEITGHELEELVKPFTANVYVG